MVAAALALLMAAISLLGVLPLLVAVLLGQGALSLAWLSLTAAPAPRYSLPTMLVAALAADLLALRDVSASAAVIALGFLAALVGELARRDRQGVTRSFAVTVTGVVLVVLAAGWVAARDEEAVGYALVAVAAACLLREVVPGPAAPLVAVAVAPLPGLPGGGQQVAIAAAAGAVAVVAGLAVDAASGGAPGLRDAQRPLSVVVPIALAGPVVHALGRLLLT